ncbi:ATP12 family chaperone protein [Paracoccus homiensis]|uniref:ATP12 family chaperone protein n=1 Tax=Paracoccus homiensis TaxID=364199 RepID=UPI00398D4800
MSEWKAKRFWKQAEARQGDDGWQVYLDGRPVRTPGKHALVMPTDALAQAVAQEWDAQTDVINPNTMPLTRAANSAIEKVAPQFDGVAQMLAEYGGTDLLSYRADAPEELVQRQAAGWDPLIDWAAVELRAPLRITSGVIPVAQDPQSLLRLRQHIDAQDIWGLTALHDLVTVPGSLILGLAVAHGRIDADEAHRLSRIDEDFQAEQWGRDDEAVTAAENRRIAIGNAARFHALSRCD